MFKCVELLYVHFSFPTDNKEKYTQENNKVIQLILMANSFQSYTWEPIWWR